MKLVPCSLISKKCGGNIVHRCTKREKNVYESWQGSSGDIAKKQVRRELKAPLAVLGLNALHKRNVNRKKVGKNTSIPSNSSQKALGKHHFYI